MKMQLIQPFISAADCVLATALEGPAKIGDLTMDQEDYRPRGYAARISIHGDIEGRIVVDMTSETALRVASALSGQQVEAAGETVRETVHELANMMIGNAVTLLNDHGYQFKVLPPEQHTSDERVQSKSDTEELAIFFDTSCGRIFLSVRMRYNLRERANRVPVPALS